MSREQPPLIMTLEQKCELMARALLIYMRRAGKRQDVLPHAALAAIKPGLVLELADNGDLKLRDLPPDVAVGFEEGQGRTQH